MNTLQVDHDGKRLNIEGVGLESESQDFTAYWLDRQRMMVTHKEARSRLLGFDVACGTMKAPILQHLLFGLSNAHWSGVISVDTNSGVKRVFYSRGEVVFAASNVIDDRLGEVIFRENGISIDQLTESAAKVTSDLKFGQVLVQNNVISEIELWEALKRQVRHILNSLFMIDQVYVELLEKGPAPHTEIVFNEPASEVIQDAFAYGLAFKDFLGALTADSSIVFNEPYERLQEIYPDGTFLGDLLGIANENPEIQNILDKSKLMDINTVAALSTLVHRGCLRIDPEMPIKREGSASLNVLKAKIDAYSFLVNQVNGSFQEAEKDLPIGELRKFINHHPREQHSIFLESDGLLSNKCLSGLFAQVIDNPVRVNHYRKFIEGLIQFLLQLTSDALGDEVAKKLRIDYRSISQ